MKVVNVNIVDNRLSCAVVYDGYDGNSEEFIIGDVKFQARTVNVSPNYQNQTQGHQKFNLLMKFSRSGSTNDKMLSVKVLCEILSINKKYAVDDIGDYWRLIYEGELPRHLNSYFHVDLIVETGPRPEYSGSSFKPLYDDEDLIDFELQGNDGSIQIHSTALAASSPALRKMLEGKWKETTDKALKIPNTTKETLQHLKDFIYLGVLPQTGVEDLLLIASCYMMDNLEEICTTQIINTVQADNSIAILKFALDNNLTKLLKGVFSLVQNGLIKVSDIKI